VSPVVTDETDHPGTITAAAVTGRWELAEWHTVDQTGAVTAHPFGVHAAGTLTYTPAGFMAGQLAAEHRTPLATVDPLGGSAAERADAYSTYVAYYGRYEIRGDTIVHQVQSSLFPNWVGDAQLRYATLADDVLILRTPSLEVAGSTTISELRWTRAEAW